MPRSEIVVAQNRVYHLGLQKGQLAPNIFLVGDPARCHKMAAYFDEVSHQVSNREYLTLTGTYQGIPISVIGTGIGTDNVEIALLEIYTLLEFDFERGEQIGEKPKVRIIRVGTSGGVQSTIPAGTMAIAAYALGMDSTGLYYDSPAKDDLLLPIEEQANQILDQATPATARFKGKILTYASRATPAVVAALSDQASAMNLPFACGITAASPGFYGPSARYIAGLKNTIPQIKQELAKLEVQGQQVINMEMESSILFHLCEALHYEAGTICPIISSPSASAALIDYELVVRQAIEVGLGAMKKLCTSSL